MTIHESSCLKSGSGYGPPLPGACRGAACVAAIAISGLALRLTTSKPELLRKFLREFVPFHFSNIFWNIREGCHATTSLFELEPRPAIAFAARLMASWTR